jgi:hypothetical protein
MFRKGRQFGAGTISPPTRYGSPASPEQEISVANEKGPLLAERPRDSVSYETYSPAPNDTQTDLVSR